MEEIKPEFPVFEKRKKFFEKKEFFFFLIVFLSFILGMIGGTLSSFYFFKNLLKETKIEQQKIVERVYLPPANEKEIVEVVKKVSPAVVSIIVEKDVPIFQTPFEWFFEKPRRFERREIGGGSGFFISEDGMILTNNHVVAQKDASYTVFTLDGKEFEAKILTTDEKRDLAIIKIEGKNFPTLKFGDSENLEIGQTVIAIGNALGEFKNTVSVGVISGLGRTITANGSIFYDVIQTDAAINRGNSGGPLLNLKGEVIGVNVAMAFGAENIGFAIPIDKAKVTLRQYKEKREREISFPYLGVWYFNLNESLAEEVKRELKIDLPSQGAWITRYSKDEYGNWYKRKEKAIVPNSAAEKAGLKEGDIILEFDKRKITPQRSLAAIISYYSPGDEISLKILREGKEMALKAVLGKLPQ